MKRSLLFCASLHLMFTVNAQVVIYQDDFEAFTEGASVAATDPTNWLLWPGGGDQIISTAQAHSGTKSVICEASGTAGGPGDLLLRLGDRTTGSYDLSWWMYVPSGNGGYFNVQHVETPSGNGSFAIEVVLTTQGEITGTANNVALTGSYPADAWFQVQLTFDLNGSMASLTLNDNLIIEWPFNTLTSGAAGPNQLGSIDFFSYGGGAPAVGLYYVDDVNFTEQPIIGINEEQRPNAFNVFPVPSNGTISIVNVVPSGFSLWRILDASGRIVLLGTDRIGPSARSDVDISTLPTGVYSIELINGSTRERHVIVRN